MLRTRLETMLLTVRYDRKLWAPLAVTVGVAALLVYAFFVARQPDGSVALAPEGPSVVETLYEAPSVSYFAQIDGGVVVRVEATTQAAILADGQRYPGVWVETFIDSPSRGMFAAPGYFYDAAKDRFYPPQPFPSWTLSDDLVWLPPVAKPEFDGVLIWDEPSLSWVPA